MAESKTKAAGKALPYEADGMVSGWVSHGAELAERSLGTLFQAVREVGGELHQRYNATVDYAEGSATAVAKVFRSLGGHVHSVFESATEVGENVALGVVRTGRSVAHDVTGLASKASATIVHARDERVQRAA